MTITIEEFNRISAECNMCCRKVNGQWNCMFTFHDGVVYNVKLEYSIDNQLIPVYRETLLYGHEYRSVDDVINNKKMSIEFRQALEVAVEQIDCAIDADETQQNKYWQCQECGYKDKTKQMPLNRKEFYEKIAPRLRCPKCKSVGSFLPICF